jgi:hypothetical protein
MQSVLLDGTTFSIGTNQPRRLHTALQRTLVSHRA